MRGNGAEGDDAGAEYSLRIAWSLARWVEDTHGRAALERFAERGGVRAEDFDGTTCWINRTQFQTLLVEGRALAGDETTFKTALVHRFKESYGAFQHMVWSISLQRMCQIAIALGNKVIVRLGHMEVVSSTSSSFRFRYRAPYDSELMCLSRRVVWSHVPTLHGLPPAELVEHKCMCRGDDCCEYEVRWIDERVTRWMAIGLGLGLAVGLAAVRVFPTPWLVPMVLALFGAGVGYALELRRIARVSVEKAQVAVDELGALGESEAETRSEIAALEQRQHAWSARMEQEVAEREAALDHIVKGLEGLQRSRATSIRGFSHDLRNPLFVVRANARLLRERGDIAGEEAEILDDIEMGSKTIEDLLAKLMDVAMAENATTKLAPQEIEVGPLVDVLRRRLRALVHGRGIDVTVTATPNAPHTIVADRLVFDRVIDNLLTNAAKYTDRGDIRVTLRGSRSGLVVELADTGRGIESERIAEIFRPRAAGGPRDPNSYGVGLSSAIRLLGQIGGGLEVASVVGKGSTFLARFPLRPPAATPSLGVEEDIDGVIANVVTVRSTPPRASRTSLPDG